MPDTDKPVVFLLGDSGVEVSNDPRWFAEQQRKQFADETRGDEFQDSMREQMRAALRAEIEAEVRAEYHAATENTGRATVHDDEAHSQLGTGGVPSTFTGQDARQPAMDVRVVGVVGEDSPAADDSDELDDSKPLEKMTGEELKAEVRRLEEQGIEVDTKGVTKKSELVERIRNATA